MLESEYSPWHPNGEFSGGVNSMLGLRFLRVGMLAVRLPGMVVVSAGLFVWLSCVAAVAAPTITEAPDGALLYKFENRVTCMRPAHYDTSRRTSFFIGLKDLFGASGSHETDIERLRTLSPRAQEFEALRFEACYEYGAGRISSEEYRSERRQILSIQEQLHVTTEEGNAGRNIEVNQSGNKNIGVLDNREGETTINMGN